MEPTGIKKWLPLITVCLGTFMLLVDVTIVTVALPDMADDLKTSFSSCSGSSTRTRWRWPHWFLGTGSIADRIGHRRAYVGGLALFAVASMVCGVSPNAGALIAARTVQGIGAAAMFATTFALLNSNTRAATAAPRTACGARCPVRRRQIGPILGGLLTEAASWRWIFFVNVPVSVLAIAMCVLVLKDANTPTTARIDVVGMALFMAQRRHAHLRPDPLERGGLGRGRQLGLAGRVAAAAAGLRDRRAAGVRAHARPRPAAQSLVRRGPGGRDGAVARGVHVLHLRGPSGCSPVVGLSPIEAGLTGLPLSIASFATAAMIGRFVQGERAGLIIGGRPAAHRCRRARRRRARARFGHLARARAGLRGYRHRGRDGPADAELRGDERRARPARRDGCGCGQHRPAARVRPSASPCSDRCSRPAASQLLADRGVRSRTRSARRCPEVRPQAVLGRAPGAARSSLDSALHAASVGGVQWTFLASGIAGVLTGLLVLFLMRPAPASAADPAAPELATA